ncbi:MAG: imidazolonepropionase [Chloroflexi bacterium]|nr:imidazolonepropionase [Chloroflexota bacterium]
MATPDQRPADLLVTGAAEIATLAGGLRRGSAQSDASVLRAGGAGRLAVAVLEGRVATVGPEPEVHARLVGLGLDPADMARLQAGGGTITPGLIDAHTHLAFAGTRETELRLRQEGAGYLDILAAGGGILSTVERTRAASSEALLADARRWSVEMLRHGVSTAEAKSGYGLDLETELRLLEVYQQLDAEGPLELVPTFLGAHAVPLEFAGRVDAYVQDIVQRQLPAVAEQGIARSCDVFCERGVFDVDRSRRILQAARDHGLAARLHADELHDSGGASLAAEIGALSADHLAAISGEGIAALGRAADEGHPVVATLLPATTFYLMAQRRAPARALIEHGVPVALGTDFNPGTSPMPNLQVAMAMATIQLGLSATEALVAATVNAAHAVGLGATHGSLVKGRAGDLVVWDVPRHELIPYWLGADLVRHVVKSGRHVHGAGRVLGPGMGQAG